MSTLSVTVKDKGAEVSSVIAKKLVSNIFGKLMRKFETDMPLSYFLSWDLKEDSFRYKGNTYPMGQHGFARDSKFSVHERLTDSITFILAPNGHFQRCLSIFV